MTVRFAVLGAGRIGRVHARAIAATEGAVLAAVADPVAAAAEEVAGQYGCDIRSIDAIEAADDVDAVVICTPTDTHADLIERFARAGKAVFCEKPVDLDVGRVRDCLKVVEDTGATLMVGFQRRFDPDFNALKAAIDAGRIGTVEMVTLTSRDPGPPPYDYIERSGGIFRDMTIHDFDVARWMLGEEVDTVMAAASVLVDPKIGELGDYDSLNVILTTASGKQCTITNTRRAVYGYDQRIEVHGSKGSASAENHREAHIEIATAQGYTRPPLLDFFMTRYIAAYANEIAAFVQALAEGTEPPTTGRDGLMALALAEAALTSVKEGRAVKVAEVLGVTRPLDLITIGRSSVDLYGAQVGGRLEDMGSFEKYIGGSPTNMAAGTARLGLKSAVITAVGDEHMGRFITEQLQREGVDIRGIKVDPERLTALVLLGIRDQEQFPLIFVRENCADMGLTEDDIDPAFIAQARAVVATGTHLSHPRTEAAVLKALRLARENGAQTGLDIDYRPNLWGLAGHGAGEERFIASEKVTAKLQSTLHLFDLIVGTEEEFHIAGGTTDTIAALRAVRAVSDATLICKRGPMGAAAFTGDIPDSLDDGEAGPGFPIEVFNVLGAGDGFMSGLLKGWLDGEDWPTALTYANACGAFAVSRHGCTPAYPSWEELQFFLRRGIKTKALRKDAELEQVHWATNRHGDWSTMRVFAFDHRVQFEDMADAAGISRPHIGHFKKLCLDAALQVADGQPGHGILCDNRLGRDALYKAAGTGLWVGRPVEWPGSRPLTLEPELGPDYGGLNEWPLTQVVKCLCFCHPDDDAAMWAEQEAVLTRLFAAARRNRLEFLLEVIPSKVGAVDDDTTPAIIQRIYDLGIYPDWWKLEPFKTDAAWAKACAAIDRNDPRTRGIVVLGLDAPADELYDSFALAARHPLVKGFAVGRTIFGDTARAWMAGTVDDAQAVAAMAANYRALCQVWDRARAAVREPAV